ncbi:MAG TPA: putative baseplate assembly protein, partial [Roseiflexaceae bacterium]|nr:putative baseplate assembly protein [Roseiflexaceae bacterium]
VTLIELFSHMVETMIYRLNRVPEKSYITFMELMGVRLKEPAAASVDLTFRLTAPPLEPVAVPSGTEVTTIQTVTEQPVLFSTDRVLTINPPRLQSCLTSPDGKTLAEQIDSLAIPSASFAVFQAKPQLDDALYLGYVLDLSSHIVQIDLDIREVSGISIDPRDPPLTWEARCRTEENTLAWEAAQLVSDTTLGLNQAGAVTLVLPPRMVAEALTSRGRTLFWVRCRHVRPRAQGSQATYTSSPMIYAVESAVWGASVTATHATTYLRESLGRSDGLPGQTFQLEHTPVLPLRAGETLEVEIDGKVEQWQQVDHFGTSGPADTHFTFDSVSGTLSFGPIIRAPDGSARQYGAVPPKGAEIRMARYRSGGGVVGNIEPGKISVLRSAVPYIESVTNLEPAVGGRDPETLEHAMLRAPRMLRTSFRAVTPDDYEYLAREASPHVARACCLQAVPDAKAGNPPPGSVRLLVVPVVAHPEQRLPAEALALSRELRSDIQNYLDDRRLLATRLEIDAPPYQFVGVVAQVKARAEADPQRVRAAVEERLYHFVNPIVGGHDGQGWPFGRDLYVAELVPVLQSVPGVEYVKAIGLKLPGQNQPVASVSLPAGGLIASGEHRVEVE